MALIAPHHGSSNMSRGMLHKRHQAGDDIVSDRVLVDHPTDLVKKLSGTFDFRLLQLSHFHRGLISLRFCHEIEVLDVACFEGNCPVWIIVTYWCGDQKTTWQL